MPKGFLVLVLPREVEGGFCCCLGLPIMVIPSSLTLTAISAICICSSSFPSRACLGPFCVHCLCSFLRELASALIYLS